MNTSDIVTQVAEETGLERTEAKAALDATLAAIVNGAIKDGTVGLTGFGRFAIRTRKAGKGRNPRTGETIIIPEREVLVFMPAKSVRDAVHPPAAPSQPEARTATAKGKK